VENTADDLNDLNKKKEKCISYFAVASLLCFIVFIIVIGFLRQKMQSAGLKEVLAAQNDSNEAGNIFMIIFTGLSDEYAYWVGIPFIIFGMSFKFGMRCLCAWMASLYVGGWFAMLLHDPRPGWIDARVKNLFCETTFGAPALNAQHAAVVWTLIALELIHRTHTHKILSRDPQAKPYVIPLLSVLSAFMLLITGICQMWVGLNFLYQIFCAWMLAAVILLIFYSLEGVLHVIVDEHLARSELRFSNRFAVTCSLALLGLALVPYFITFATFKLQESWQNNYCAHCSRIDLTTTLGIMLIPTGFFSWMPLVLYMRKHQPHACYFEGHWGSMAVRATRGLIASVVSSGMHGLLWLIRSPSSPAVVIMLRCYISGAVTSIFLGILIPFVLINCSLFEREVPLPLPAIDTDLTDIRTDADMNNRIALQSLVKMNRRQIGSHAGGSRHSDSGSKLSGSAENPKHAANSNGLTFSQGSPSVDAV